MTKQIRATIEHDEDGWWAYYNSGYKSSIDPVGVSHTDHADTKKEINKLIAKSVLCTCQNCKKETAEYLRAG